jgi:hypothetical protein
MGSATLKHAAGARELGRLRVRLPQSSRYQNDLVNGSRYREAKASAECCANYSSQVRSRINGIGGSRIVLRPGQHGSPATPKLAKWSFAVV